MLYVVAQGAGPWWLCGAQPWAMNEAIQGATGCTTCSRRLSRSWVKGPGLAETRSMCLGPTTRIATTRCTLPKAQTRSLEQQRGCAHHCVSTANQTKLFIHARFTGRSKPVKLGKVRKAPVPRSNVAYYAHGEPRMRAGTFPLNSSGTCNRRTTRCTKLRKYEEVNTTPLKLCTGSTDYSNSLSCRGMSVYVHRVAKRIRVLRGAL